MRIFRNENHVPAPGQSVRTDAIKMVLWQFAVIVVLSVILFLLQGTQSGLSALLGGLAYCIPNFMFVWRVFERTTARAAKQFLTAFLLGEVTKLLLSAVLFILIVKFLPVKVISVLGGYIAAIMAFWVVSFITMSQE
jgi:ATP synthase protein I